MTQRNRQLVRVLRVVSALRDRPTALDDLAREMGVSTRTIRRDLAAIEEVYTPVSEENEDGRRRYRIVGPASFA